jgi:hypothetical protein
VATTTLQSTINRLPCMSTTSARDFDRFRSFRDYRKFLRGSALRRDNMAAFQPQIEAFLRECSKPLQKIIRAPTTITRVLAFPASARILLYVPLVTFKSGLAKFG